MVEVNLLSILLMAHDEHNWDGFGGIEFSILPCYDQDGSSLKHPSRSNYPGKKYENGTNSVLVKKLEE